MGGLNPCDACGGGMKSFEAKHWTGNALYEAVVLFKDIVEILLLPDCDELPIALEFEDHIDRFGKTLDFMLSKRRNKTAATKFFARAIEVNGLPTKILIDKSGVNTAGIIEVNRMLKWFGCPVPIEMVRIKWPPCVMILQVLPSSACSAV